MDELRRITTEKDRLLRIFSDLDENELQVAKGLISQAAFMLVTLEDLQKTISKNGAVDEYKNGKDQYGIKLSAELQAYNQTMRTYNSVIGKLLKIVPHKIEYEEDPIVKWDRIRKEMEQDKPTEEDLNAWHEDFCEMLQAVREGRPLDE